MIAYYAHSIGSGHSNLAQEFCKEFQSQALVITSSSFQFEKAINVVKIDSEDVNYENYLQTIDNLPKYAHFLPKSEPNILRRNFQVLQACLQKDIKFALIDLSVETAIQFRIAGIPYAYHKLFGKRNDAAHQMTFLAAEFLFAYYPKQLENEENPAILEKTKHIGFVSRFPYREQVQNFSFNRQSSLKILIILSSETKITKQNIYSLCKQTPQHIFTVISKYELVSCANVKSQCYANDLETIILSHDIVIASSGLNLTAELIALKNKFIAIAEPRHYDEHIETLNALIKNNLAVELNLNNLNQTIDTFIKLPKVLNLETYFGSAKQFRKIKELQKFL